MLVVGIDSGSISTGFGVVEEKRQCLTALEFGAIRPKAGLPLTERIGFIFNEVLSIFDKYSPDMMALEDIFMAKNAQSALKLGQVRGAVIAAAKMRGLKISEFSPTLVKSAVTGYGRAEKSQVAFMVTKILGLQSKPSSEDASDALAIAITALLRKEVAR
jgi:crossover junction endodeoxyribonuclease RuvC